MIHHWTSCEAFVNAYEGCFSGITETKIWDDGSKSFTKTDLTLNFAKLVLSRSLNSKRVGREFTQSKELFCWEGWKSSVMVQQKISEKATTFMHKCSFFNGTFLHKSTVNPSDVTRARNAKEKLSHLFPKTPSFLRVSTKVLCFHSMLHHQINEISNSFVLLILIS